MAFIVLAPRSCPTTRRVSYVERPPVRTPGRDGCRNCGWSGNEVDNTAARRPLLSVPCGTMGNKKVGPRLAAGAHNTLNVGGDLLSHTPTSAVPSALEGLASGFGMGPGVPPPP